MTYLNRTEWIVRDITMSQARPLVQEFHYSKDYAGTTSVAAHGLMRRTDDALGRIWGAAIWLPAVNAMRRYGCLPLQLTRLVVTPDAPKNAASFLMAHSMALLDRKVWPVLLTYADTGQGHSGAIYRATNWQPDGTGGGWTYYSSDGRQTASLHDGRFIPCPPGWEARKTLKHRFVHAVAASSDAPGNQSGEGGSQLTLPLHPLEPAA